MRAVVRVSIMWSRRAEGVSHGAAVVGHVCGAAFGARDQRAQRPRTVNAVGYGQKSRRRMRLLFRQVIPHDTAWQERIKELSNEPAVDDFALSEGLARPDAMPRPHAAR